ncbi:MAG: hypothetical protein HRT71_20490 [Flavobacteriales bacterium]|nr:hypothetical protein [Flavobacteriales bacterium]
MKTKDILIFILALFTFSTAILAFFPSDGIPIGFGQKLYLPNLAEVLKLEQPKELVVVSQASIINEIVAPDSVRIDPILQAKIDSVNALRRNDSIRKRQLMVHYPAAGPKVLFPFFKALERASKKPIRILHYGDSQIEGDRITGYLRNKLQSKFGGSGPGLIAPIPLANTLLAKQEFDDNWEVFRKYMIIDKRIKHGNYGPMLNFISIFTPEDSIPHNDTIINKKDTSFTAQITLSKSRLASKNVKDWRNVKVYFNQTKQPFLLQIKEDTTVVYNDTINPEVQDVLDWDIQNTELKLLNFKFSAVNQFPEVTAFSIEGKPGVWVDNIPLRGAGGTAFASVSNTSLSSFYDMNNIQLLILQFGGNALYAMKKEEECEKYGMRFEKNIKYLKSLNPHACVVIIGPSDMSVKDGVKWKTHPFLEKTRDALKQAALNTGSAYWDMYEAMGGQESMPLWVKAEPKLAYSDHIHFTRKGAGKVADWFYTALISDYRKYKEEKTK